MSTRLIVGVVLLVAGAVLLLVGMNAPQSVTDSWGDFLTGHFTDVTVRYVVVGAASVLVGMVLMRVGRERMTA